MSHSESSFPSTTGDVAIATYRWKTSVAEPLGVVQIEHGLAEHGRRYQRLAKALNHAGYSVYAKDHRGHGKSVATEAELGSFGAGGWQAVIGDVAEFGRVIGAENPGLPVFLIAHSMGAFAAQHALLEHSDLWAGVVLTGSSALDEWGARAKESGRIKASSLAVVTPGVEPRTGFEWLTRDEAEVDSYLADPLCGFTVAADILPQVYGSGGPVSDPARLARIRGDLPILVVSGQDDRLAGGGALVQLLADRYREAGVQDVTLKLYEGARHELFNETNRDEVTAFVIGWLMAHSRV